MKKHTRRDFLKTSAGSAGLLAAAPSLLSAVEASRTVSFAGSDVVPLGKTGLKVSRLAQGTGFNGGAPVLGPHPHGTGGLHASSCTAASTRA